MTEAADGVRRVERDEVVARADDHEAGPGTYRDDAVIRARYDGELVIQEGTCSVRRARRAIPNRRRVRGAPTPDETLSRRDGTGPKKSGSFLHGLDNRGRLRGKRRKGRGDQGAWD